MDSINMIFSAMRAEMKEQGNPTPSPRPVIRIPVARELLKEVFLDYYAATGAAASSFQWLKEYDAVGDWLTDNGGKGLFMFGDYGRGKSFLARYVLPAIILHTHRKVFKVVDAGEINREKENFFKYRFLVLDDIGTEEIKNSFGNKTVVFTEVMDYAEKTGALLIITSNLNDEAITAKYGIRTMERVLSCCTPVKFTGQTLRQ